MAQLDAEAAFEINSEGCCFRKYINIILILCKTLSEKLLIIVLNDIYKYKKTYIL